MLLSPSCGTGVLGEVGGGLLPRTRAPRTDRRTANPPPRFIILLEAEICGGHNIGHIRGDANHQGGTRETIDWPTSPLLVSRCPRVVSVDVVLLVRCV